MDGLTVEDTPGIGIVSRTEPVVIRNVCLRWRDAAGRDEPQAGRTPRFQAGAYGLYPVESCSGQRADAADGSQRRARRPTLRRVVCGGASR